MFLARAIVEISLGGHDGIRIEIWLFELLRDPALRIDRQTVDIFPG